MFMKRSGHRSIELIRENVNADVAVLNVLSGATLSATNGSAVFDVDDETLINKVRC